MAIVLDRSLLIELGLGSLPQAEQDSLLSHVYETLEMRVGMRLADQMSNEQLEEFEKYFEAKDDEGAFKWLETNFPNYKEIVQDEFNKLKEEVRITVPQILQASQVALSQQTMPQGGSDANQVPPSSSDVGPAPNVQSTPTNNPVEPYQPPQPPAQAS